MPAEMLKKFLDDNDIKYISIMHSLAFTSTDIARQAHIPSKKMAKTVILNIDGKLSMAVVPANSKVNLQSLQNTLNSNSVGLACESEFTQNFPDCEVGAMPPFGNLYDMDVYVDERLTSDQQIAFNAGSHLEIIQMDYQDFESLVKPQFIMLTS